LRIKKDDVGLRFDIDLPNNSWGDDILESIKRGDVDGVSFGFRTEKNGDKWEDRDGCVIRTINKAKLLEISPTPFPSYPQSEVSVRSAEKSYDEFKQKQQSEEDADVDYINLRKKLFNN
jgi:HK97 family phage prohead protease